MNLLLLKDGAIYDGTGVPAFHGSVLIDGERIAAVGNAATPPEARVIDCRGLAVAPGFIDAHSHSDLQVLEGRREKTRQGVTAEVVGNCGFSPYPAPPDPAPLREFANGIFCGDDRWGWPSPRDYLAAASASPAATVHSLVGHGSLRIAVAGHRLGALENAEVERMECVLDDALAAGAAGLSTGLMYAPGSSAPFEELERLCRVVARRGKIYATHMRSYFGDLVSSVEEQIELARRSGCRLQISHLQAAGARSWPEQARAIERIEAAQRGGIDIAFDCYPYVAGSTVLTQALPQWVLEGGIAGMMGRLTDAAERARIAAETERVIAWRWSDIYISAAGSSRNRDCVGKNLAEIAGHRGSKPIDAMIDLLVEETGAVNMLCFNQSEENLRQTLTHPLSIIGSDGFYVKGRPHPRLHGTFPLLLGEFVRRRRWLTLEEAIHKITLRPAKRFQFKGRGRLTPGSIADITVFDPGTIDSPATYEDPELPPAGVKYVFRAGRPIEGAA